MADDRGLVGELCRVAQALGIEVRSVRFRGEAHGSGGMCWLRGRRVILLNRVAPAIERCSVVAQALGELDTDSVPMSDEARRSISQTRYAAAFGARTMNPGIVSRRPEPVLEPARSDLGANGALEEHVDLAGLTSLRLGGPARFFLRATTERELFHALTWAETERVPAVLLGGGSNLVVSDTGFPGLVIQVALMGTRFVERHKTVELSVAAGEPWDAVVAHAVGAGWQGIECLSGIPGLVGATPIQNVGAYGQEVAEVIKSVRAFDRVQRRVVTLSARDCRFGYRDSLFKSSERGRFVVLDVTYRLLRDGTPEISYAELGRTLDQKGEAPSLGSVRESVLALRRAKSMLLDASDPNSRSCGSFFVNPVVDAAVASRLVAADGAPAPGFPLPGGQVKVPAAWLIEQAGFRKGERFGSVGISERHALALVSRDGATTSEVVRFAHLLRSRVRARFGIELVPEPVFWGFDRPELHELPTIEP